MRTGCPNCEAIWGMEEIDFEKCFSCGFPNDMDEHRVNEKHCVHCNKEIQIAEEFEEVKTKNAIPAFRWNDDDEVYIGGICWECADKLCDSGEISISGGGATVPNAYFM